MRDGREDTVGSVERVQELLAKTGEGLNIVHLEENTRTAELAALALGAEVGAIVKSLVFIADGATVLALVSGDKRADPAKVAALVGAAEVEIARAREVKERTGFAIGGVPPLVRDDAGRQVPTVMDRHLFRYPVVYAAAGSPYDIFPVPPRVLERMVGATVADLAAD